MAQVFAKKALGFVKKDREEDVGSSSGGGGVKKESVKKDKLDTQQQQQQQATTQEEGSLTPRKEPLTPRKEGEEESVAETSGDKDKGLLRLFRAKDKKAEAHEVPQPDDAKNSQQTEGKMRLFWKDKKEESPRSNAPVSVEPVASDAVERHHLMPQPSFQNVVLGTAKGHPADGAKGSHGPLVLVGGDGAKQQSPNQGYVAGADGGKQQSLNQGYVAGADGVKQKKDSETKTWGHLLAPQRKTRLAATRTATVYGKGSAPFKANVALVGSDVKTPNALAAALGDDHRVFILHPQVFRIQPLQLELPDLVNQQEDTFYFKFGWVSLGKPVMMTTQSRGLPFVFSDMGSFCFDLPDKTATEEDKKKEEKRNFLSKKKASVAAEEKGECFLLELWKSNRLKDSLFGSIEVPLETLLRTAGSALEQQHDLWYSLRRPDNTVVVADVRLAIEFGRSDQSLEKDIRSHIVRLIAATPGDVEQSAIWPQSARFHTDVAGVGGTGAGFTNGSSGAGGTTPLPVKHPLPSSFPSDLPRPGSALPQSRSPRHASVSYCSDSKAASDDELGDVSLVGYSSAASLFVGAEYGAGNSDELEIDDLPPNSSSNLGSVPVEKSPRAGNPPLQSNRDSPVKKTDSSLAFNEEWQQCVERLANKPDASIYETISNLSRDFCATARRYGSLIVSELHLPDDMKTIQPSNMGGVIGGAKYIVGGILYKVARPSIEGQIGEEEAMKIAGHELKALTALFNVNSVNQIGLNLPMMACIDVLGFRLLALGLCPLSSNTLIHGSADGGHTIMQDADAEARLRLAASCLNLKVHSVRGHEVPLAVDVECHAGRDGRLYLIDLSRTLPPQKPNRSYNQLCHLFQLLRPELVRSCPFPLCSDACSAFVNEESDRLEHASDVARATEHLLINVVPMAAIYLDGLHTARSEPDWSFFSLSHLKRCLHVTISLGVNRRFLGQVRKHCTNRISQQLLLVDIVSRTVKKMLRKALRETLFSAGRKQETHLSQTILSFWNVLLSQNDDLEEQTKEMWDRVAYKLQGYFGPLGSDGSCVSGFTLWCDVRNVPQGTLLLFQRTTEQVGTTWSKRVHKLIDISIAWFEKREKELERRRGMAGKLIDVAGAGFRAVTGAVGAVGSKFLPGARAAKEAPPVSPRMASLVEISPRNRRFLHKRTGSNLEAVGTEEKDTTRVAGHLRQSSASGAGFTSNSTSSPVSVDTASASSPSPAPDSATASAVDDEKAATANVPNSSAILRESTSVIGRPGNLHASSAASAAGVTEAEARLELSPFEFWAVNSTQMLFEDDVADIAGARLKLNNVAAMAQGIRLMALAQSKKDDPELLGHFRSLTSRLFEQCLQNNPTNSQALREFALVLLDIEAQKIGKSDWKVKDALLTIFWSSGVRYVDFLFRMALESNPFDSECLYNYALFQAAGGRSPLWLLVRAALCDHFNTKVMLALNEILVQRAVYQKEITLMGLWIANGQKVLKEREAATPQKE